MEGELFVGRQRIRFNREATIVLYRDIITAPGADTCTCISCKNFAAQRGKAYPDEFLHLLDELGIDPLKEWEAFDYDFDLGNRQNHLYGGWFVFSGELVEGGDERPNQAQTNFVHWITTSFPTGTLPKDVKVCAIEFCTQIPWILPETPE
jgi:hypothetical protein